MREQAERIELENEREREEREKSKLIDSESEREREDRRERERVNKIIIFSFTTKAIVGCIYAILLFIVAKIF